MKIKSKILAMDRDKDFLRTLQNKLESSEFEVMVTADIQTGLEMTAQLGPDLILLGLLAPDPKGKGELQSLKDFLPTKGIPVIMFSSLDTAEARAWRMDAGADDCLSRSYDVHELISRIKALLRRTEARTRERYFNLKLIHYLIGKFQRRGYQIYSPFYASHSRPPNHWIGPLPDLLSIKQGKKIAVSLEDPETLLQKSSRERWKVLIDNGKVRLILVVHSRLAKRMALLLKKEYGVNFRVVLERERWKLKKLSKPGFFFARYLSSRMISLLTFCVFFSFLLTIFVRVFPNVVGKFVLGLIYNFTLFQPKDSERQLFRGGGIADQFKKQIHRKDLQKFLK